MKNLKRILTIFIIICLGINFKGYELKSLSEVDQLIPSIKLQAQIKQRLEMSQTDELRVEHLSLVKELVFLSDSGIEYEYRNLDGIQHLTNLVSLTVNGTSLDNLSNIIKVPNLRTLSLTALRIGTLDGLSSLSQLDNLHVSSMYQLYNIQELSNLVSLKQLHIYNLGSLNTLPNLERLVKLEELSIDYNRIGDWNYEIFSNLTLIKKLNVHTSFLNDLALLEYFPNLEELKVRNTRISSIAGIEKSKKLKKIMLEPLYTGRLDPPLDLSPISELFDMEELYAPGRNIHDISALTNLTHLTIVDLSENEINNLDSLVNKDKLTQLNVNKNPIGFLDANIFNTLINLQYLQVFQTGINSLEGISLNTKLEKLQASYNELISLDPISNLINIKELFVNSNQIVNLDALANLDQLEIFNGSVNQIVSIEGLKGKKQLTELYLEDNKITDIAAIEDSQNLVALDVRYNELSKFDAVIKLKKLQRVYLNYNHIVDLRSLRNLEQILSSEFNGQTISYELVLGQHVPNPIYNFRSISYDRTSVFSTDKRFEFSGNHINLGAFDGGITFDEFKETIEYIAQLELLDSETSEYLDTTIAVVNHEDLLNIYQNIDEGGEFFIRFKIEAMQETLELGLWMSVSGHAMSNEEEHKLLLREIKPKLYIDDESIFNTTEDNLEFVALEIGTTQFYWDESDKENFFEGTGIITVVPAVALINYVDSNGEEIAPSKTFNGKHGAIIEDAIIDIPDYKYNEAIVNQDIKFNGKEVEYTLTYNKKMLHTLSSSDATMELSEYKKLNDSGKIDDALVELMNVKLSSVKPINSEAIIIDKSLVELKVGVYIVKFSLRYSNILLETQANLTIVDTQQKPEEEPGEPSEPVNPTQYKIKASNIILYIDEINAAKKNGLVNQLIIERSNPTLETLARQTITYQVKETNLVGEVGDYWAIIETTHQGIHYETKIEVSVQDKKSELPKTGYHSGGYASGLVLFGLLVIVFTRNKKNLINK